MTAKPRILVVDDERPIACALATALELQGYETARAHSGEEAVQIADSFQPDFLLSDVAMGAMNGIEAAQEILRTHPECKVLFLSGSFGYDHMLGNTGAEKFSFEVLLKPVPLSTILARVAQALAASAVTSVVLFTPAAGSVFHACK